VYEDDSLFNINPRPVTGSWESPNVTALTPARGLRAAAFSNFSKGRHRLHGRCRFFFEQPDYTPRLT
jgi:hypothetical protein